MMSSRESKRNLHHQLEMGKEARPLLRPSPPEFVEDAAAAPPFWRRWWTRADDEGAGDKQIGTFGSLCLLINSITGPAIVSIPVVVQKAGWLTPLVAVVFMWAVCLFSSLLLVHAMALVPGNNRFQGKVELTTLVKFFFPRWFFYLILFILTISLLSLIIASLIVSAQTLDFAMVEVYQTCGLEFYPDFGWQCVDTAGTGVTPFGDSYVLSLGMVVILLIVAPLGYLNLNKNIIVQEAAVVSLVLIVILWTVDFFRKGTQGSIPLATSTQSEVLGTIMFNFVMAITLPSWCSEKASNVSVKRSLFMSTTFASVLFYFVGIIGALAFVYTEDNNLLTMLQTKCDDCFILTTISGYFIPAAIFVTSIPVYAIVVRYNLIDNNICNNYSAFFISVIFPWLIAIPFYTGSGLTLVINFASLFLQSTINFILPVLIYVRAVNWSKAAPKDPEQNIPYSDLPVNESLQNGDDTFEFQAFPPFIMKFSVGIAYSMALVIVALVGLVVGLIIYTTFI